MQPEKQPPSDPVLVESEVAVLPNLNVETLFVSATGNWSCCDVWMSVPQGQWTSRVTLRLYGRVGKARVLLQQVAGTALTWTTANGVSSTLAMSLRGHPCAGFEVTCTSSADIALDSGSVYLQCWDGGSASGSTAQPVSDNTPSPPAAPIAAHVLGFDGALWQRERVDSGGHPVVVGSGTAGVPAGGVLSVQGAGSGGSLPVSQSTPGALNAPWPVILSDATSAFGSGTNPIRISGVGAVGAPSGGVITVQGGLANSALRVTQPTPSDLNAVVTQGPAGAQAARWPVFLSDGTNPVGTTANALVIAGAGVSGTPSGGVLSIQGTQTNAALRIMQPTAADLNGTVTQGPAGAQANRWPVYLSDGSTPLATSSNPLITRPLSGQQPSYVATTNATIPTGTAAANVASIAYLWHPGTSGKRIEIFQILISFGGGVGTSMVLFRGARITAVSGTPGGTSVTPQPLESSDPASTGLFVAGATGAPTRASFDQLTFAMVAGASDKLVWNAGATGKPIVLGLGRAEGFELRTVLSAALSTAANVAVTMSFLEY